MMQRLIFALVLAALLSFATAACGGGSGDSADDFDFGVMTFDDLPEDAPTPTPPALDLRESWVVEVGYVHQQLVTVDRLRRVMRDLTNLAEAGTEAGVGLDWVAQVHEGTLAAEDFFEQVLQQRAPVSVENRYYDLSKALVEAVQMCAYGSDRVLAASLILGPSGRTVERLESAERAEFDKLVRESAFYLSLAEGQVELLADDYQESLSELRE